MKRKGTVLAVALLLLVLVIELGLLYRKNITAEPVYPLTGIITADPSCNMRRDPNTSREALRELKKDVKVTVLGEAEGQMVGSNPLWYEISYGNIHGYVSAEFVRLELDIQLPDYGIPQITLPATADFRAGLEQSGFPQDYINALMALHEKYPNWKFTPLFVNYSFETAVRGEFRPGVNMVTATAPPEYKSKADADFNYVTNTWYQYEPGWVGASKELIAFQMDPRNFLNEIQIFQFENQRYNGEIPYLQGLNNIVRNTFMEQYPIRYLDTEGETRTLETSYPMLIEEAGRNSGVSPYHLISRILQEVGPQGSSSVRGDYLDVKGYYNFFNIGAFGGSDPLYMGLVTARDGIKGYSEMKNSKFLFPWVNPSRAISGGAIFLGEDYINVDQHTLYLQKFNLASRYTRPFTHQYMGNVLAPEYEAIDVYKAYQNMGALADAKEFVIPVFLDMPDVVPSPTGGGNVNNWLKAIYINGEPITDFQANRYEYKLNIKSASKGLFVEAVPWNRDAAVYGNGVYRLGPGINEIIIQVNSPAGTARNYRLSIYQSEHTAHQNPSDLPKVQSHNYQISALGYLYGVDPNVGANASDYLVSQYSLPDSYRLMVVSQDGQTPIERAGTGSVLQLRRNDLVVNEFPIVILGDINGDGLINFEDQLILREHILNMGNSLTTAHNLAMDINQDGYVNIIDLKMLIDHVRGVSTINQYLGF